MSDYNQRKIGAILSYATIAINTVIQLVFTPFLIKMLGQSEYGLYSLVSSIIGYLTIMDLGFGNAIIVFTAKYRVNGEKEKEKTLHGMFNLVFKLIGLLAAVLGLVLYFCVDSIFGNKMSDGELHKIKVMMLILSFNLFCSFFFAIYNSIISAYEKFIIQKIVAIIHSILNPLLMIPLLLYGYRSISLCILITITNISVLLFNYYYCRKKLEINTKFIGFDKSLFKIIFGYSIWIFLGIIVDKVNYSVDNMILGSISGTIAVSIYSVATTFNMVFINISTAISGLMLPKMTKLVEMKASASQLTDEMIKIGRLQNYVIMLAYTGFVLLGKQFIHSWVGLDFDESYYVTLLLITPACIPLIQNTALSIMQAMNKYRFKSLSTAIMAGVNVIISICFAKLWGTIGAALGTCIALVICNVVLINVYYYKRLNLDIIKFWKSIFKQDIPFIIPVLIMLIITKFTRMVGFRGFIVYAIIYVAIFSTIAYLFSMNKYEKKLLTSLPKKILKKRR